MKPFIGITPFYDCRLGVYRLSPFYCTAVESSGGIPVILPYTKSQSVIDETLDRLDGILLSGGDNVDPNLYGEKVSSCSFPIEYERDLFEIPLCKTAAQKNKPLLGICRGCQLLAVAFGGNLHQNTENHMQSADRHTASHTVKIFPDTPLYSILNAPIIEVNSFHRQSVNLSGELKSAALSNDGVVEALYLPNQKFFMGVQWHPERTYCHSHHSKLIFDSFISSCCR